MRSATVQSQTPRSAARRGTSRGLSRWLVLRRLNGIKIDRLVLVDGAVGPTGLDLQTLEWFDHIGIPVTVIATKHDKVKSSRLGARKQELAAKCGLERSDVRWVSATTGNGIPELRADIRRLLECP